MDAHINNIARQSMDGGKANSVKSLLLLACLNGAVQRRFSRGYGDDWGLRIDGNRHIVDCHEYPCRSVLSVTTMDAKSMK